MALGPSSSCQHPRSWGSLCHGPFAAVVEAQDITISLLFISAGVKSSWGCWALMGEAPALCSPLLDSQHGPMEGKTSLGAAVGFYSPENESQHRPCLSGEQGHVTAQETTPWERQLVKEGKKPKGLGWRRAGSGAAGRLVLDVLPACSPHAQDFSPIQVWDNGVLGGFHCTWSTEILFCTCSLGLCCSLLREVALV